MTDQFFAQAADAPSALPDPSGETVYLGFSHAPLFSLGPGQRIGVWFKGCPLGCPGCVSPELRTALAEDRTEVSALAREILESARALGSSRVTVSGGEPFYQPEALEKLLRLLREGGIKDILVYTGRKFHCLSKAYPWLFELVSALVDGPFEESRPTDAIWKGSAGQKFYLVDSALKEDYQPWLYGSERRVQVVPCAEGLRVLGIPKIGDYGGLFH